MPPMAGMPGQLRASQGAQQHAVRAGLANLDTSVFPPAGFQIVDYPHDQYDLKSVQAGVHQAHLRSPQRRLRKEERLEAGGGESERFYQSVMAFAAKPMPIETPVRPDYMEMEFDVTDQQHANLSITRQSDEAPYSILFAEYHNGALRYRLKCCLLKDGDPPTSSEFVMADNVWPPYVAINISEPSNGRVEPLRHLVETRRKAHNGKDLPAELTGLLFRGRNVVTIVASSQSGPPKPGHHYYVAVEVIETLSHSSIIKRVMSRPMFSKAYTVAAVQKRLGKSRQQSAGDDDVEELEVVGDDREALTVSLADPFTAGIFTVPVRGIKCTHLEVFDLATWLASRPTKSEGKPCDHSSQKQPCHCPAPGKEPSLTDKWRCPHCLNDARPVSLRIDEYLLAVRRDLEARGRLDAKSISIFADGRWQITEAMDDDDDDTESDSESPPATGAGRKRPSVGGPAGKPQPKRRATGGSAAGSAQKQPGKQQQPIEIIEID